MSTEKENMYLFLKKIEQTSIRRAKFCASIINKLDVTSVYDYGCGLAQLGDFITDDLQYI